MNVISIFDASGIMVQPWHDAGHDVLTIDMQTARHNMPSLQVDIKDLEPRSADILFCFVPCTNYAVSGARWWKDKGPEALAASNALLRAARRWCDLAEYWMIENPIGRLSSIWRRPDWSFDPYEYAGLCPGDDQYTKRTCIWSNWEKPPTCPLPPVLGSKMHRIGPGPERQYMRSLTPAGFSRAVYNHLSKSPAVQLTLDFEEEDSWDGGIPRLHNGQWIIRSLYDK